jgi:hypothetical protein
MSNNLRNYIGLSRDHSASMGYLTDAAMRDYNSNISAIKEAAIAESQDTLVSVVQCGVGRPATNMFETSLSSVTVLRPLTRYEANGSSTPLYDSVGMIIDQFKQVPDANDETTSFLVMITTDGEDNSSKHWSAYSLGREIKRLQATDRWTFVFRVPKGSKRDMMSALNLPEGNVLEWDVNSAKSLEVATQATTTAMKGFYAARSAGVKSTSSFYSDMTKVTAKDVKAVLTDISKEVSIWSVSEDEDGDQIKDFCERRIKGGYTKGTGFYELTKPERKVQDHKKIVIRDKKSKAVYGGAAARDLLGLPHYGDVRLVPGDHGNFDIFIQSTSTNRKLFEGSAVLYWPNGV